MQTILCSALLLCFAFAAPLRANDVITNFMSPIVSYQYPDDYTSEVLTNGGAQSPFVSYQYYEWPGSDVLSLKYSPTASYYYPLLDAPVLNILFTNRVPTTAESTPAYLSSGAPSSQLLAYHGGIFTTNLASMDPNQPTIVLTHGWIPLNPLTQYLTPLFTPNGVADWPTVMASLLKSNNITSANVVAWNWADAATSGLGNPGQAGSQTPQQGVDLGLELLKRLGANYSHKIQFIGHSFGTLVNAYAANFLQGNNWAGEAMSPTPWPATNMLMTLFDEAEVGADKNFVGNPAEYAALAAALAGKNGNYANLPSYYHPLPRNFAWAENYVSEFGLLKTNAANVILTVGSPANAPNPVSWFEAIGAFHGYPCVWYEPTIQTDNSAMGYVWPFVWSVDDPAFAQAPTNGSVYVQADTGNPWNLTPTNWNYAAGLLIDKIQAYGGGLGSAFVQFTANTLTANGTVAGQSLTTGLPSWMVNMSKRSDNGGSSPIQLKAQPLGSPTPNGAGGSTIIPAYAWMELIIPPNAVSMAFDYKIQDDWQSDSLAAALNGTNVLLISGNTIQTNVTFSSGAIDVSAYAGQTNEFFIGVVGGTSTNAELTVMNLVFSISLPPLLQVQSTGNGWVLSWPLSAQNFNLQTTTNLADPNSWTTLTNVPAVVDLQNAVANPVSDGMRFYRLKK